MASAAGARNGAIWGAGLLEANQPKVLGQLEQGYDTSRGLLGQGLTAAQGYLGQAGDLYGQQRTAAQPGMDRYAALTTGDGASMSRALESTPGYQFSMDQGLQALNRRRAAGGMLNSGNADADAISFGSGLASQTLNQERQALMPYLGMYQGGVQGGAGTYGQMANTASSNYGAQAGLATDYFGNRASVYDDTTKNIVGLGVSALKAGDQAKSANQAMMMQGAQMAVGLLGGSMGGGGGSAGGFTKLFGG